MSLLKDKGITVSNGNDVTLEVKIDPDCAFEVDEIRTTGTSKVYVELKNSAGISLCNSPFNAGLIGAGNNRLMFPMPLRFSGGKTIQAVLTNNTGSNLTDFDISFIGRKIYKYDV
jgi:hypothetical protein